MIVIVIDHSSYYSYPRSNYVVTLGTGYAGRGYYYGPRGAPYYYQSPGVRYYATRSVVPREYLGSRRLRPQQHGCRSPKRAGPPRLL